MMNDHFVQSELEYRRQQRLTAAAEYRRARSAARVRSLRSRLGDIVELIGIGRRRHVAGTAAGPATGGVASGSVAATAGCVTRTGTAHAA